MAWLLLLPTRPRSVTPQVHHHSGVAAAEWLPVTELKLWRQRQSCCPWLRHLQHLDWLRHSNPRHSRHQYGQVGGRAVYEAGGAEETQSDASRASTFYNMHKLPTLSINSTARVDKFQGSPFCVHVDASVLSSIQLFAQPQIGSRQPASPAQAQVQADHQRP